MVVTYSTKVIGHKVDGTKHVLCLKYSPEDNRHLVDKEVCWGTSTLEFDTCGGKPKATWKNSPSSPEYDGTATGTLTTLSPEEELEYEAVIRIKRRQYAFKKALLGYSATCELSGESESSALDAAHIIGVSELGAHTPDNGLLLRTDLHRLFDGDLLHIDPDNGKVSLGDSIANDSGYRKLVKGMKLQPKSLDRVHAKLRERKREG